MRRARRVAALGVACAILAGCTGLPTDSPVQRGDEVGVRATPSVRQHFAAPNPGARAEDIVRGFIAAGAAPGENFGAARAYLASNYREAWAPRSRPVTIVTGLSGITVQTRAADDVSATLVISSPVIATVAVNGRASELAGAVRTADITLSIEDGQWRISSLPEDFGVWLDQFDFDLLYGAFTVSYVSSIGPTILPDRRWFPLTNALPTTLARSQLEPVPTYLLGAGITGFPPLTRLRVDAVTVTDGVATLDLTQEATSQAADERRAAYAQALVTVAQAPAVRAVSLQLDGQPLTPVGLSDPVSQLSDLGFTLAAGIDPTHLLLRQGTALTAVPVDQLRASGPWPDAPRLPALDVAWTGLALAPDFKEFAATSGDGRGLLRWRRDSATPDGPGRSGQQRPFGTALTRPSYDAWNGLWVGGVSETGDSAVWVIDTRGDVGEAAPRRISVPWLEGDRVVSLKVAPDGQRVAMLLAGPSGPTRLAVAGVIRGEDKRALSLGTPLMIGGNLLSATAVTWMSGHQLALVGRAKVWGAGSADGSGEDRAFLVGLDGRVVTRYGRLPSDAIGGVAVSAGSARGLLVVAPSGRVYQALGNGWQAVTNAQDLVIPGG